MACTNVLKLRWNTDCFGLLSNLFDGIDHYEKTGEIDESTFYAGSHGDWIADLAIALKNDTKQRFLVI